jgi:hypothetical protein
MEKSRISGQQIKQLAGTWQADTQCRANGVLQL